MTKMPSICAAALALVGLTLLVPAAQAADTTPASPPPANPAPANPAPASPAPASPAPAKESANPAPTASADTAATTRAEARIKQLHAELKITPAEEAQWKDFADVMRSNAREMGQAALQIGQQADTMTALQSMQSYEQLTEANLQRLQKLLPAFAALYNAMSADQKKVADQVFRVNGASRAQTGSTIRPQQ
jgi:protein CpxP